MSDKSNMSKFGNVCYILAITEIPDYCRSFRDWRPFGRANLGDIIDKCNELCINACKERKMDESSISEKMEYIDLMPKYIIHLGIIRLGDWNPRDLSTVEIILLDIDKMKDRRQLLRELDRKLIEATSHIKDEDKHKKYYHLFQIGLGDQKISLYEEFSPNRVAPSDPEIIKTEQELAINFIRLCRHYATILRNLPNEWTTIPNIQEIVTSVRDECLNENLDVEQSAAKGFRAVFSAYSLSTGRYKDYVPQFYPGSTKIGINRIKHMSGTLERLRDISEADIVAIMGNRAPGADYSYIHPPIFELGEPDCPIRQIVSPTAGAAAGDRIRYSQWVDSFYFAPSVPYWRSYWGAINCRGSDPGTLSGRQTMEARERDIEAYTKKQFDSEMTDVALCSMRGCTVHGHSLRLQENGMMFDMLARTERGKDGNVYQVKDQVGIPLDKKINLGKPWSEAEAKNRTTIFRVDGVSIQGKVGARKYDEAVEALHHMWELRTKWGFRPE